MESNPFTKSLLFMLMITPICTLSTQNDTIQAKIFVQAARENINNGKYNLALLNLDSAETIYLSTIGEITAEYGTVMHYFGVVYYYQSQLEEAIYHYTKAIAIREHLLGTENNETARTYNNLGRVYEQLGDYIQAIEIHQKTLQIRLKINSADIDYSYANLGLCYRNIGDYDQAIYYYKLALQIRLEKYGENADEVASMYIGLGNCYTDNGDYEESIESTLKSISILNKRYSPDSPVLAYAYSALSRCYIQQKDFIHALEFKEKELSIWVNEYGAESIEAAKVYSSIGVCYRLQGNYPQAINFHEKAVRIFVGKIGYEEDLGVCYNNLGACYQMEKKYSLALEFYQSSLNLFTKYLDKNHPYIITTNNNIGNCFIDQKEYNTALSYYSKSLYANHYVEDDLSNVVSIPSLIESLNKIGIIKRAIHYSMKEPDSLLLSFSAYQSAREAIRYQRTKLLSGKKDLVSTSISVFEGNIQTDLLLFQNTGDLHYVKDAFACMEESRAVGLLELIQDEEAIYSSSIPDSILHQERSLSLQIAQYEKQRFKAQHDEKINLTDTLLLAINTKLYRAKTEYNALKQNLEIAYPAYYYQKYDFSITSIEELQQQILRPDQTLLEYLVVDSSLFIMVINKTNINLVQVSHDGQIGSLVNNLRKGLYSYYDLPAWKRSESTYINSLKQYTEASRYLYEKLIAPVKLYLTSSIVIIADPQLAMLPFEALLKDMPSDLANFSTYPFLLRQYQVSYCYSATLLREMTQKRLRQQATGGLIAFAPFYLKSESDLIQQVKKDGLQDWFSDEESLANRKGWSELPCSGPEVYYAAKCWKGIHFIGAEASKSNFLEKAGLYKILHLSTHGVVDSRSGEYSYLAFSAAADNSDDSRLYVKEIYPLALTAELVILSACETAVGEIQRGEGVINLSRAFASAGAKSIITSLWVVNDGASEMLMRYFHDQLKTAKTKDEALHLAKLRYIQQHPGEKSHPFFWAGFVGVGDMKEVK